MDKREHLVKMLKIVTIYLTMELERTDIRAYCTELTKSGEYLVRIDFQNDDWHYRYHVHIEDTYDYSAFNNVVMTMVADILKKYNERG